MKTTGLSARLTIGLLCCMMWSSARAGVFLRELTQPGDFSGGIFNRTEVSQDTGGVTLCRSINCIPFLWVPSAEQGVVSKIDARTGAELARYAMGPKDSNWTPYSVAVDNEANAYIACGTDGPPKIVKICAAGTSFSAPGPPGQTSFDTNGDRRADALAWGSDSRVSLLGQVGTQHTRPSALALDANGLLWVGLWDEQSVVAMDINKGTVLRTVLVDGKPDTMIAGPRGSLLVACGDTDKLCQIDTLIGAVTRVYDLAGKGLRSMCLGEEDYTVWLGTNDGLVRLDSDTGSFTTQALADGAGLAGIALDKSGDIWAACPSKNQLIKFSAADLRVTAQVSVGHGPDSISSDKDGYIWSLNAADATASRVDPRTNTCVRTAATCRTPFSSTPFDASLLRHGISPSGGWRMLFDSKLPGAGWGTVGWDCALSGGLLKTEVRSANLPTAIADQQFMEVGNGQPFVVPNGRYLEVQISFSGSNNVTPILFGLAVQGKNLPPDVSKATPTSDRILKLDHSFETVKITGVTDPEKDPVTIAIMSVTQDEPVAGAGPNDKAPDAVVAGGASEVKLRGERDPGTTDKPGNGRVYTVTFKATDVLGASTVGKVKVTVPPELRWNSVAIDDKRKYDSTKEPEKQMASK